MKKHYSQEAALENSPESSKKVKFSGSHDLGFWEDRR
jgi:hypothetical protein